MQAASIFCKCCPVTGQGALQCSNMPDNHIHIAPALLHFESLELFPRVGVKFGHARVEIESFHLYHHWTVRMPRTGELLALTLHETHGVQGLTCLQDKPTMQHRIATCFAAWQHHSGRSQHRASTKPAQAGCILNGMHMQHALLRYGQMYIPPHSSCHTDEQSKECTMRQHSACPSV